MAGGVRAVVTGCDGITWSVTAHSESATHTQYDSTTNNSPRSSLDRYHLARGGRIHPITSYWHHHPTPSPVPVIVVILIWYHGISDPFRPCDRYTYHGIVSVKYFCDTTLSVERHAGRGQRDHSNSSSASSCCPVRGVDTGRYPPVEYTSSKSPEYHTHRRFGWMDR